ncbi:MAG: dynamin family protein [Pseudomonadota bacterium]
MTYANHSADFDLTQSADSKPRIALMGEFSAGKSTLCNLILGEAVLPTKVTATRLPPVWVAQGDEAPFRMDTRGQVHEVDLHALDRVVPEDTCYIKVHKPVDLLGMCDLIDMPGISDPNMATAAWDDVTQTADAVIWCTHATQAWRQSEAAAWAELPDALKARSLLLLTRFDKLTSERDQARVIRRVEVETGGAFRGIYPMSLLAAMEAGDDPDLLRDAGAETFARGLVDLLGDLGSLDR